jgi:putative ABC transport system permease protein
MLQDLKYALRQLRKSPGFTLTAVLTLALGTGVTAAVFSVIYAVMIQPLPYEHPETIVVPQTYSPQGYTQPASYPEYVDWRTQNHSFSALAAVSAFRRINLEGPSGPVSLRLTEGSDNLFDVFGVNPILGRTFSPGEDQPGKSDVVVLSYEVWQQNFGGAFDVVGRVVRLDGLPYTVIGVMPAGFRYPISQRDAIYTPLHMIDLLRNTRGDHWLPTVGRLKPGVSATQAQADMDSVFANIGRLFPDSKGRRMELSPIAESAIGSTRGPLQVLLFAVLAVLAIACVNLAGLLLARGVKREREVALRSAIGATRARLVRQMLTESLVLALAGSALGALLAYGLLEAIRRLLIAALSRGADVRLNLPVLLATIVVSVVTSFLAGSIPAFRLSRVAPSLSLKVGGSAGTGRGQHRLRASFIVIQVALAMMLLVTAGLLLRLLSGLNNTDLGFETRGILSMDVNLPQGTYKDHDPRTAFYDPLLDKIRAIPGVQSAGVIQLLPIESWGWNSDIAIVGQPPAPPNQERLAEDRYVDPGFFQTMGIHLVRGRMVDPKIDTPTSAQVAVVNEAFVKKFFSNGEDPIGKQIKQDTPQTIVGVVSSVRQDIYQPAMAEIDYPTSEIPEADARNLLANMQLVVRSAIPEDALIPSLRRAFHDVDPSVPFAQPETMHEVIADVLTLERLENWLFGSFAALALLLAAVGIYGLIAHEVELSTRDIGVRMALGASRTRVLEMIYKRVGWMLASGVMAGLAGTLAARKVIASVVEMKATSDAPIIAGLVVGVMVAGVIAAWFPAQRAAAIEPMTALRSE